MKNIILFAVVALIFVFSVKSLKKSNCPGAFVVSKVGSKVVALRNSDKAEMLDGCPLVKLEGKLTLRTFAGVPNYESIEEGDTPVTRWIFEFDRKWLEYLWSFPITDFYRTEFPVEKDEMNWIQLTINPLDEKILPLQGKKVAIEGFLGQWETHVYTPFLLEVIKISEQ